MDLRAWLGQTPQNMISTSTSTSTSVSTATASTAAEADPDLIADADADPQLDSWKEVMKDVEQSEVCVKNLGNKEADRVVPEPGSLESSGATMGSLPSPSLVEPKPPQKSTSATATVMPIPTPTPIIQDPSQESSKVLASGRSDKIGEKARDKDVVGNANNANNRQESVTETNGPTSQEATVVDSASVSESRSRSALGTERRTTLNPAQVIEGRTTLNPAQVIQLQALPHDVSQIQDQQINQPSGSSNPVETLRSDTPTVPHPTHHLHLSNRPPLLGHNQSLSSALDPALSSSLSSSSAAQFEQYPATLASPQPEPSTQANSSQIRPLIQASTNITPEGQSKLTTHFIQNQLRLPSPITATVTSNTSATASAVDPSSGSGPKPSAPAQASANNSSRRRDRTRSAKNLEEEEMKAMTAAASAAAKIKTAQAKAEAKKLKEVEKKSGMGKRKLKMNTTTTRQGSTGIGTRSDTDGDSIDLESYPENGPMFTRATAPRGEINGKKGRSTGLRDPVVASGSTTSRNRKAVQVGKGTSQLAEGEKVNIIADDGIEDGIEIINIDSSPPQSNRKRKTMQIRSQGSSGVENEILEVHSSDGEDRERGDNDDDDELRIGYCSQRPTKVRTNVPSLTTSRIVHPFFAPKKTAMPQEAPLQTSSSVSQSIAPIFEESESIIDKTSDIAQTDGHQLEDANARVEDQPSSTAWMSNEPLTHHNIVSELPPRKRFKIDDGKPTHVFFNASSGDPTAKDIGHNLESLPVANSASSAPPAAPPPSFISINQAAKGNKTKTGWGANREPHFPRWPSALEIQVGPNDRVQGHDGANLARKGSRMSSGAEDGPSSHFWRSLLPKPTPSSTYPVSADHSPYPSIFPYISQHPALHRIIDDPPYKSSQELWVDRYRPTQAKQVLGNEIEATYLLAWMKELALAPESRVQHESKPKKEVVRKLIKTRKKKVVTNEDDWIVEGDDINDFESSQEAPKPQQGEIESELSTNQLYPSFANRLTNSILLQGPHGIGKTAAVYAAATELDWEVFEVYPGVGKRSGSHILELVGDVGKNHTIGTGSSTNPKSPSGRQKAGSGLFSALNKPFAKSRKTSVIDVDETPIHAPTAESSKKDNGSNSEAVDREDATPRSVRQSLILLEEVDILFEEDKGFWQAVVSLIAESKRPVVMTCNDLSLVHFEELALQTTLLFSPPPSYLTIPYLETILRCEDIPYDSTLIPSLIDGLSRFSETLVEQTFTPSTSRWPAGIDVRAALTQLQMGVECSTRQSSTKAIHSSIPELVKPNTTAQDVHEDEIAQLKEQARKLEIRSYADSWVLPRPEAIMEAFEIDRYATNSDDEVEVMLLEKPKMSCRTHETTIPFVTSSELEMGQWLMDRSEGIERVEHREPLNVARSRYLTEALHYLDPMIPLDTHLLPHPCIFLDYAPAVRNMVRIDDNLEREEDAKAVRGDPVMSRQTGRVIRVTSVAAQERGKYVRQMAGSEDLDDIALDIARKAGLSV